MFLGQTRLLREVSIIEEEMRKGNIFSLLIQAPSGWGKTTLAQKIIDETFGKAHTNFSRSSEWMIDVNKKINFIDEIQEIDTQDVFYEYIDDKVCNFIFATNELGKVREPLVNRCIPLIFDPYTFDEIVQMVLTHLNAWDLHTDYATSIARRCKLNPRITRVLCTRLNYIFRRYSLPSSLEELDDRIMDILGIDENGLTAEDRVYLYTLKKNGGKASLALLRSILRLDQEAIVRDIEPSLILLGYINITSKGRELIKWESN